MKWKLRNLWSHSIISARSTIFDQIVHVTWTKWINWYCKVWAMKNIYKFLRRFFTRFCVVRFVCGRIKKKYEAHAWDSWVEVSRLNQYEGQKIDATGGLTRGEDWKSQISKVKSIRREFPFSLSRIIVDCANIRCIFTALPFAFSPPPPLPSR